MLTGHPLSAKLPGDAGFGERFWYWRGASGRSYIHSIYPCGGCPPLPGAVYLAVRRLGGYREVLSVGRFSCVWDESESLFPPPVNEIHVHLLARSGTAAEAVMDDLRGALPNDVLPPMAAAAGSAFYRSAMLTPMPSS